MGVEEAAHETVVYCTVHPQVEATLRCNRCSRPMCLKCAVRTPVGYRCRECVRGQQDVFYSATPQDYVIAGVAAFLVSAVAAGILLRIGGLLITFLLAVPAGGVISEVVWRAVRRRRGRYLWIVVGLCTVLGVAPISLWWFSQYGVINAIDAVFYIALAGGAAAARFRFGARLL